MKSAANIEKDAEEKDSAPNGPPIAISEFLEGRVRLMRGDCRQALAALPDNSVDSIVTDPPYALESIRKRFGGANAAPAKHGTDGAFARASRGFMGQQWDTGDVAFDAGFWAECLRVLKPGGHLLAFSGTRTYHHMAVAIDDAGFEVRDQMAWAYGTGFPKNHNVSKAIDKHLGAERQKVRLDASQVANLKARQDSRPFIEAAKERGYHEVAGDIAATPEAAEWDDWGTALKPAWEPICVGRKPLMVPNDQGVLRPASVAENVLYWGVGGLNIGGCRISAEKTTGWGGKDGEARPVDGRFPANILHDGSDEVMDAFPSAAGQQRSVGPEYGSKASKGIYGDFGPRDTCEPRGDGGSAARFFYSAKADADDRLDFAHPTVKPVDLMRWLVRLVTPKHGVTLDPFAGTGTTGHAAFWEGCNAILCEREAEYQGYIEKRMALVLAGPDERKRARTEAAPSDDLPLFGADEPPEAEADPKPLKRRAYGSFAHDKTGKRYDPAIHGQGVDKTQSKGAD